MIDGKTICTDNCALSFLLFVFLFAVYYHVILKWAKSTILFRNFVFHRVCFFVPARLK